MSLAPGQTLLHYEILAPLGAGAMGEVWRARDTRLGREVAVKVLPEQFAEDEERLRRFEREARSVASLNHPCVAQIHDVDQVDDLCFLVLELVPGETLEERLQRGPLPLGEALTICARIADGLEAAHDVGIIHRDLKPANVRLTPDGKVKLLDFGLARPAFGSEADASSSDSVLSTEAGRLLGTPTYMAPEQARGRPIDRRVDVWAFGCVLYECLTARRAWAGESLSDVLAAVLEREPDWDALPSLPAHVESLLRRCLVKDPRQRLRDVGEARLLLDDPNAAHASPAADPGAPAAGAPRARTWLAITSVALVVSLLALAFQLRAGDAAHIAGPMHFSVQPPDGTRILFSGDLAGPPTVSPDGTAIAFGAARDNGPRRLWIRRLDEPDARELLGTDGALFPFWSPDGRELGYFTGSALCRYDLINETVSEVADVGAARGGAFTDDGRIIYASSFRTGLFLVAANNGEPVPLTVLDKEKHTSHRWPAVIPGTDRFVFSAVTAVVGEEHNNGIYLGTLDSREPPRHLMSSDFSAQVVKNQLLHVKDGSLLAVPIDLDSGETQGHATVLARGLAPDSATWHGQFSASPAGVLALSRPSAAADGAVPSTYSWSLTGDRVSSWSYEGRKVTTYATGTPMFSMALRPDGRMLAMDALSPDGFTDIWLYSSRGGPGEEGEIERGLANTPAPQRLTFLAGPEFLPVWSPDGAELVFRWDGDAERPRGIYRKRIGGGSETLVRDNRGEDDHASDWTTDGRYLIVTTDSILSSDRNDIIAVPLDGGPELSLVAAPGPQYDGRVSPDGRWLAYVDSSERASVFVIPFAPAWPEDQRADRWLVSENGGYEPRWSPDGTELYYMTQTGTLIAVDVVTGGESFSFSTPRTLFQTPWRLDRSFDPRPGEDGKTLGFMFLDSDPAAEGPISVILGWQALLEEG